ncbi:MAG: hypothetical protein LBS43_09220 [Prevotellaceae bacterium]|jgi:hypothetical protein|nr:hypothetical protein [Prevotellaceae bacterium]
MNDFEDLKEIVAEHTHLNIDSMTIYDFFLKLNKILTDKGKKNAGKHNN